MFRLIGSFHFETSPKGRFCPSGYIIHIGFIPFTDFTFFNQIPYPSVIQGEGTPRFPDNSAHSPYSRCSPPVCLMLTTRIPGTWEIFAKRPKSGMCLHPISPMNRELDEKRWSRWKGQKIYRKDILKNKKHSPEKRCYIFFWNLHIFPLKPVTSFFKRCYVFLKKMLRLQADKSC